tara:strand:+ start:65 stop:361 length:297 start_codon:yes stop_codon:yes gene_type:complete
MENDMLQTIILHSITMMIADEIYASNDHNITSYRVVKMSEKHLNKATKKQIKKLSDFSRKIPDLKKLSPNCADIDIIKFAILSDFFIHFTDQKTGATQ